MREAGRGSPSRHEAFSPRPLRHGPRTTSDIVAAPREMHGARSIGIGSKLDAGSHGTVLKVRARVSPFSLTNHDAPWSGIGLARAMSVSEVPGRLGTRTAPTLRSAVESRDAHGIRHHSPCFTAPREFASRPVAHRTSPVAQQRCPDAVRSRFEEAAGSRSAVVARRIRTVVKGRWRKKSKNGTLKSAATPAHRRSLHDCADFWLAPPSIFHQGELVPLFRP